MMNERFVICCAELGVALSDVQLAAIEDFERRLYAANETTNLTRIPREECWLRHFVDSLLIQDLIPEGARALDIGSGPGFPAWPLAWARPDVSMTALDSSGKTTDFLNGSRLPNLVAVQARAESWGRREAFDFVTGRAVAPLAIQLELSAPACSVGGRVIPMRTPNDLSTIERLDVKPLGLQLSSIVRRELPGTDVVRIFPVYEKTRGSQSAYPRSWAEIKSRPFDEKVPRHRK